MSELALTKSPGAETSVWDEARIEAVAQRYGTPLFVLDTGAAVSAYRELVDALPEVVPHYAIKALGHPDLLSALARADACFDVAGDAEVDAVLAHGVSADRLIHTHPHKKPEQIAYALARGITTFTADCTAELEKLAGFSGVEVMARLCFPNSDSVIDLSSKFGMAPPDVLDFVESAAALGVNVRGLSFHVGSQSLSPNAFLAALRTTLELFDRLRARGHALRTIDIGGGFPVRYRHPVASFAEIAARLRPIVARRPDVEFISEPGRYIAAPCMVLLSCVVTVSRRPSGEEWVFIDDGVYGGYSNVLSDHTDPLILATAHGDERAQTIAGPTCDSTDVVARSRMLPQLAVGDVLMSPNMGAYTTVTATDFNGIGRTPIVVLD